MHNKKDWVNKERGRLECKRCGRGLDGRGRE